MAFLNRWSLQGENYAWSGEKKIITCEMDVNSIVEKAVADWLKEE